MSMLQDIRLSELLPISEIECAVLFLATVTLNLTPTEPNRAFPSKLVNMQVVYESTQGIKTGDITRI